MAVRQYIGARYVPTYYQNSLDPTSSEWEANVSYDPLTIVSLPNMHSYQSKKFVPASVGSPASNPEYWYDQGYASAYYQALQDQIDDMKDGSISGSLQDQINDNTSDIQALKNKSIILVAASYGITPTAESGCVALLKTMLTTAYKHIYDASQTGVSFVAGTYLSLLQSIESTVDDPETVTDIVIIGYGNDEGQPEATLLTAMQTFSAYCNTTYPNAKISLAPVSIRTTPSIAANLFNTYNQIVNHAADHKISVMGDLVKLPAINYPKYIYSDHPTAEGAKLIASGIYSCLLNGSFNVTELITDNDPADKTTASYITSLLNVNDVVTIDTKTIHIYLALIFDVAAGGTTISGTIDTTPLVTANPAVKGCTGGSWNSARRLQGTIFDTVSNKWVPVQVTIKEDSGNYWYYVNTIGPDLALAGGTRCWLRVEGISQTALN